MIQVISSQQYEQYAAPNGQIVIDAPASPLDGSVYHHHIAATQAIEAERERLRSAIDDDLSQGGPLMQGLALFASQLQELGWDELDLKIDLHQRIVIFPCDEMLAIADAHRFFEDLISAAADDPVTHYPQLLHDFQERQFCSVSQ